MVSVKRSAPTSVEQLVTVPVKKVRVCNSERVHEQNGRHIRFADSSEFQTLEFTQEDWELEQWEWELRGETSAFQDDEEDTDDEDEMDLLDVASAAGLPEPQHVSATYRAFSPGQAVVINSTYPDSHRIPYSAKVVGVLADGSGVCFEIDADAIEGHGWEGWAGKFALAWEHIPSCVYLGTEENLAWAAELRDAMRGVPGVMG